MLNHTGTVTINTERLILRRFTVDDAEDMFNNWANDEEVTKFLSWPPHGTVDHTREVIGRWVEAYEAPTTYNWAIEWKETGKVVGNISAHDIRDDDMRCEIGYCLGRAYWNMNIMTEALKALIDFFLFEVGMNRVQATHDTKNTGSGKVMQKAGMKLEGTLRQFKSRKDGTLYDLNMYSILKSDKEIRIIGIRENPEWFEEGAKFFHHAFGNNDNFMLYYDCIKHSLKTESPLPRWFIAVKNNKIIGGCGLIANDFISRSDLWPWLAALYVNEEERGHALGSKLLAHAVAEAGRLGFPKVYLCTDHDGYYEKYGWKRIEDAYMLWGEKSRVYEIETCLSQVCR